MKAKLEVLELPTGNRSGMSLLEGLKAERKRLGHRWLLRARRLSRQRIFHLSCGSPNLGQ